MSCSSPRQLILTSKPHPLRVGLASYCHVSSVDWGTTSCSSHWLGVVIRGQWNLQVAVPVDTQSASGPLGANPGEPHLACGPLIAHPHTRHFVYQLGFIPLLFKA